MAPPAEVLPAEVLPAEVSPVEGPQATVTGELRRVSLADGDGTRTAISAVVTPDGDAVQVLSGDVADVPIGSTVTVTVDAAALDSAALEPDGGAAVSDLQVLEAAATVTDPAAEAAAVPAPRDVHVLSGLLPGQTPAAIDLAPVVAAVANASDYFSTSTGGTISLAVVSQRDAGTYAGWGDPATCDPDQVFALLDWAAQEAGIFPAAGSGKHAVIQTPSFAACADLGLIADVDDGGVVWLNGATGAGELDPWAVAQALGHTLGLGSSHARTDCVGLVDGRSPDCVDAHLGSAYDLMGWVLPPTGDHLGTPGPLNGAQLDVLGVLDAGNAVLSGGPATATLRPVGGLSGVRFYRAVAFGVTYYVELRAAVGPDADLGTTRRGCVGGVLDCTPAVFRPGVIIHRLDGDAPTIGSETFLVEAGAKTPRLPSDPPPFTLAPGRSVVTDQGGLEIGLAPTSPTGTAVVTVKDGPGAAVHIPFGNFESATATVGGVVVKGWALDRDIRVPSLLIVNVSEGLTHGSGMWLADSPRPDIARVFPEQGPLHGFDLRLPLAPGTHQVCVQVLDNGPKGNTNLGCRTVTWVAGGPPLGMLDKVEPVPGGVRVTGWALDPDTFETSYVLLEVAGRATYARADQPRPDVARFFPAYQEQRGFSTTLTTPPGTRTVCATAVNYGIGTHTSLGCRTVSVPSASPIGHLDGLTVSGGKVAFRGWAIDPDVPGAVTMWIDVDGRGLLTMFADQDRPDIGVVFPQAGPNHGFSGMATLPAGARNVCVWAINNARGSNVNLGCRPAR